MVDRLRDGLGEADALVWLGSRKIVSACCISYNHFISASCVIESRYSCVVIGCDARVDGGDLAALSYTGQQPLHLAAVAGDISILRWLKEQGLVSCGALCGHATRPQRLTMLFHAYSGSRSLA